MCHNLPPLGFASGTARPDPVRSTVHVLRHLSRDDSSLAVTTRVALHVNRRGVLFLWNKTNTFSIVNPVKTAEDSGELKLVELICISIKSVCDI